MKTIWSIVLTYNNEDTILKNINCLLGQTRPTKILIIDNSPNEQTYQKITKLLEAEPKRIIYVKNPGNNGYAGGINSGIKYLKQNNLIANSDFFAVVNPDAYPQKNWLEKMENAALSDPKIAMITGKTILEQENTIDSTGDFYNWYGRPYPRGRGSEPDKFQISEEVFGCSGAQFLARIEAFESIKLKQFEYFNELFFMYYEDVDISMRLRLAGFKNYYQAEAIVYHECGYSSANKFNTPSELSLFHASKNAILIYACTLPKKLQIKLLPKFLAFQIISILFSIIKTNISARARISGVLAGLKLLRKSKKIHKVISKNQKISDNELLNWFDKQGLRLDFSIVKR